MQPYLYLFIEHIIVQIISFNQYQFKNPINIYYSIKYYLNELIYLFVLVCIHFKQSSTNDFGSA